MHEFLRREVIEKNLVHAVSVVREKSHITTVFMITWAVW